MLEVGAESLFFFCLTLSVDVGYFMKFDTSVGEVGNSAILESRILYPRRSQQCLQFFYRMTGHAGDKLAVWLRTDDGTGNVQRIRKLHTITGSIWMGMNTRGQTKGTVLNAYIIISKHCVCKRCTCLSDPDVFGILHT